MFPTESFRVCVRPAPSDTRMSAENSTFCANVDTADIKNNDMVASPREKAFISAPCSLRSRPFGSAPRQHVCSHVLVVNHYQRTKAATLHVPADSLSTYTKNRFDPM